MSGIRAELIAHSISPAGAEIATFLLRLPRFIAAELLTHRTFDRNAASSRAIPIERIIRGVVQDPAIPVFWGANESGMSAHKEVDEPERARSWWIETSHLAVLRARQGAKLGLHKQIVNRVLEAFSWHDVLVTATDWDNFFFLRVHPKAEDNFQVLAAKMLQALRASTPKEVPMGGWHLPFPQHGEDLSQEEALQANVGRAARLSYQTHDGRKSAEEDVALYRKLVVREDAGEPMHLSPTGHVATPLKDAQERRANLVGWESYRSRIPGESGPSRGWWKGTEARLRLEQIRERFPKEFGE